MRILILSINYWPEETGIGAFTTYRAEYLASVGHDVTICTTFPYYPDWRVPSSYRGKLATSETRNGVRILRSYAYIPNPVTSIRRVAHEASFVIGSFIWAGLVRRPDLLLTVSPPLGLGLSSFLLSRIWRTPYVFDVMDLQPDAAADLEMLPPWMLRLMYKVEGLAYRYASLVSTLTNGMRERIIQKGIPERKVALFEPRADDSLLEIAPEEGLFFRRRFGLEGKFVVSHSGNLGVKQGLEVVLDAAALCEHNPSVIFLLVGNGAARKKIEQRAIDMGLNNVRFLPLLEPKDFRGLLAASDVCLVTQRKSVSDVVFPSKVVTYLVAGCPIIASVNPGSEVARTVKESNAGVCIAPEDPIAMRDAIDDLCRADLLPLRANATGYANCRWSSQRVLGSLERQLVAASNFSVVPLREQENTR